MRKRELLNFFDTKIKSDFDEAQSNIYDGAKVVKAGINIMITNYFIESIKKQKPFLLKTNLSEFAELYSEVLNEISDDFTNHMDALVDSESSFGIKILEEAIEESRSKKNKGDN